MENAKLYVAFYRPQYGNYQHWALYLEDGDDNLIFDVKGSHPHFERAVAKSIPEKSGSFLRKIFMGAIQPEDVEKVKNVAKTTKVDNETLEWDCQEYVLDVLETLEKECIVDDDDEDYKESKEELTEKRGANN